MKLSRSMRLATMGAIGGIGLISSLLALASINGGGGLALGDAHLLPLAAGYDRRAQAELSSADRPPPNLRATAATASRRAIGEFPYDTGAWLRLAYLDRADHGRLSPAGVAALSRSYDLVAVDPDFALWRIGFALENSDALPRPLRASVKHETASVWRVGSYRRDIRNLRMQLKNSSGRLSLILWINEFEVADIK